jgi:nucleoside-diphosphate-sugar epimerase
MKKIAITGANGFVGSRLVRQLAANHDVICLVRENSNIDLLPKNANIRKIEYNDLDAIREILVDCDVLIHSAALTRAKNWQTMKRINIDLTEQLLKISGDLKQFVFISSQAASGPAMNNATPVTESDLCKPLTIYGKSKMMAEELIRSKAEIPYTIIRPVSVFGSGDSDFLQYFKMIKNFIAVQIGFDEKHYNFIYVNELVKLIDKTILNKFAYNETFFAADPKTYTMQEFIKSIEMAMNRKSIHLRIPVFLLQPAAGIAEFLNKFSSRPPLLNREKVKEFRQSNWLVSTEKAKKLLAFESASDLTEQMKETYNWYKDKGWI